MIASSDYAAIITASAALITTLTANAIQIVMTCRQSRKIAEGVAVSVSNSQKLDAHADQLQEVKSATSGLTEKLQAVTKEAGVAEGRAEGLEQGRSEAQKDA